MRALIADNLSIEPADVLFIYVEKGKPSLANHRLFFNLSHSHNEACIAVSSEAALGVDVEYIRPPTRNTWADLARRFFSSAEIKALSNLPDSMQSEAFFACWTRKEAFVKALGKGLTFPLRNVTVSFLPGQPTSILKVENHELNILSWSIYSICARPLYAGALVVAGKPRTIKYWDYQEWRPR